MKSSFSISSSSRGVSRRLFESRLVWVLVLTAFCATIFGAGYWIKSRHAVFLKTVSPTNAYEVHLKGSKGRPFIIPNQVRADVFKAGQLFISEIWLHSAWDSFDLSFEAGFPDTRWLDINIVEFYRPQYYDDGADSLLLENKSSKSIKYLQVESESKFLIFDLQSRTFVSIKIPAPRGDKQLIVLRGALSDGMEIPLSSASFDRRLSQRKPSSYKASIDESGTAEVKDVNNR